MTEPEPLTLAELEKMDKGDVIAYFEAGGSMVDVLRHAKPGPNMGPAPDRLPDEEELIMRITSVRLPLEMVVELDHFAGRDKDGRSGLVRKAINHYLEHLRESA